MDGERLAAFALRMKIIWWIGFVALFLLSASTGVVKLVQMEAEMVLFRGASIPDIVTIAFGGLQLAAAVALLPDRTRRPAAVGLAASYIFATGIVFSNGMLVFGVSSLTFIALAAVYIKWPLRPGQPS